jgi:hypothetical protein
MMKTLVQLSETIRDHLIKQRAKSQTEHGSCKYRNDAGLMCAVGCLIADDVYEPGLEGKLSDDPRIVDALKQSGVLVDETSSQLFRVWQAYHDSFYTSGDVLSTETYRYIDWVKSGNEANSPTNFHDMILKELTV